MLCIYLSPASGWHRLFKIEPENDTQNLESGGIFGEIWGIRGNLERGGGGLQIHLGKTQISHIFLAQKKQIFHRNILGKLIVMPKNLSWKFSVGRSSWKATQMRGLISDYSRKKMLTKLSNAFLPKNCCMLLQQKH